MEWACDSGQAYDTQTANPASSCGLGGQTSMTYCKALSRWNGLPGTQNEPAPLEVQWCGQSILEATLLEVATWEMREVGMVKVASWRYFGAYMQYLIRIGTIIPGLKLSGHLYGFGQKLGWQSMECVCFCTFFFPNEACGLFDGFKQYFPKSCMQKW